MMAAVESLPTDPMDAGEAERITQRIALRLDAIADKILDSIDSSPSGVLYGEVPYVGPVGTIQSLARAAECSEGVVYRTVLRLYEHNLVRIVDAVDPTISRRRLFVIGEAVA